MIYILYGQPGSGKTSIGRKLATYLKTNHHIDGDEFRKQHNNNDYSRKGREYNIKLANKHALYLYHTYKQPVILSLVNPYEHLRAELTALCPSLEILLQTNRTLRKDYHVNDFDIGNPGLILNTDQSIDTTFNRLILKAPPLNTINGSITNIS